MTALTMEKVLEELPEVKGNATSIYFRQSVYNRWAVTEIFRFIDEHPEWKTVEAIEHFIVTMDKYIDNSVSNEMNWIFCVAKDEAEYLRDWFVGEEFRYTVKDKRKENEKADG